MTESSFLQTNDRIINLKNVSNINIIDNRIVFNTNYNIEYSNSWESKLISDYVYWDAINSDDLLRNIIYLNDNKYFQQNFINKNTDGYININEISSIKFSDKKLRVIFNLSHPVTFQDYEGHKKITSEFVYVNFSDSSKYKVYIQYIKSKLVI